MQRRGNDCLTTDRSFVEVRHGGTAPLSSVIREPRSDTLQEALLDPFAAIPGIDRRDEETDALILTSETPLTNTVAFSISDRVSVTRVNFFLQPHSTDVVWVAVRLLFVFQHHSKRFGLYYDILCPGLVSSESSGGPKTTATILTKKRTFILFRMRLRKISCPRQASVNG